MSIESFANAECAAVLNEAFIPVLIDRESRPDLDTIYMNYVQAVSNVGGWPLNLFVTPELEPIFGGTYWPGPNAARRAHGDENAEDALDFLTIVKKVRDIWKEQEARCRKEATEVLAQLREFAAEGTLGTRPITQTQTLAPSGWSAPVSNESPQSTDKSATVSSELDLDQLEEAYTHIAGTFDPVYGGFGLAPKFLTPPKLQFLIGLHDSPSDVRDIVGEAECTHATDMAVDTLRKIRDGALHDHVGATGFARCSVTPDWTIPNFEKLVVDNAQLLSLYLTAWTRAGGQDSNEFYDVVLELAQYLTSAPILRSDGLLASSEAADSYVRKGDREMKEGAYYLWTRREFDSVIEAAEKNASQVVAAHWGILEDGNVDEKHDPNDDFMNQNILRVAKTPEELSKQFSIPVEKVEQSIRTAQKELKARRESERMRPEVDDKAVTGWNGLALSALAKTAAALKAVNPEVSGKCSAVASGIASFIQKNLWDAQAKVLYRIWTGIKDIEAFADDYAYMIQGLLDLFDTNGDETLLEFADTLQSKFHESILPAEEVLIQNRSTIVLLLRCHRWLLHHHRQLDFCHSPTQRRHGHISPLHQRRLRLQSVPAWPAPRRGEVCGHGAQQHQRLRGRDAPASVAVPRSAGRCGHGSPRCPKYPHRRGQVQGDERKGVIGIDCQRLNWCWARVGCCLIYCSD